MFYVNDTVIIAENADSLQRALDVFSLYSIEWELSVNTSKSKIMIFSKRKTNRHPYLNIEIFDSYTYLGIKFSYNRRFCTANPPKENPQKTTTTKIPPKQQQLTKQATKAIFRKVRRHSLTVDIQMKIIDSLELPILLYCCEVWGFEKLEDIEQVHLTFCKISFCVKKSTLNFMIYGELGRFPLKYKIYSRIINYWKRNIESKEQKLLVIIYNLF